MKALQVHAFDAPIQMTNVDIPEPSRGQIRIKIAACGLNFADLLMQKGTYQDTPEPPFTLGMEVAGLWMPSALTRMPLMLDHALPFSGVKVDWQNLDVLTLIA